MSIKLIVFDLWDTLAFRDVGYRTTDKILEETKVSIPKDKFVKIFEESLQTKKWESKYQAYENLCKNMGLEPNLQNVNLLLEIREEAEAKTKLFPHAITMLQKLKANGFKIGIISNSSIFAVEWIKNTGLLNYIDYPLFSFDVGTIKPDPKFFLEMLRRANCEPEEAIMIGDKLTDDVLPAKNVGMNAILFQDYERLKKEFANFSIYLD